MTELESYRQWMHPAHEFAPKMRTLADVDCLVVPQALYDEFADLSCAMSGSERANEGQYMFKGEPVVSCDALIAEKLQRESR